MNRLFLFLLIILVQTTALDSNAQSKEENFQVLTTEEGLSHSVITSMMQDSRGFMWFGTPEGLNLYDGCEFQNFFANDSSKNTISGSYIRSIFEDSEGNIWIGTEENGLNLFNKELFTFEKFNSTENNKLCSSKILSIYEDFNKTLWIGTDKGLCIFNKDSKQFKKPQVGFNELNEKSIKCFLEDDNNNLWIGTNSGLYCITNSRDEVKEFKHRFSDESTISNNEVHCISKDNKGWLFVGTNSGLNIVDPTHFEVHRMTAEANKKIDLSTSEIYSILEDKTGNLWFGTFGSGLVKWDNKNGETTVYTINPLYQNSISNDYILSLLIDKSGLLWIGTYGGGINKLNLVKISFGKLEKDVTSPTSILSNEIYAICEDDFRNLWIGTDNGISVLDKIEGKYYNITADEKNRLKSNTIYSFTADHENNFWVGTNNGGLHLISQDQIENKEFTFKNYTVENTDGSLLSNDILYLYEDEKDKLWIGTSNGLNAFNYKLGEWESYKSNPQDPHALPSDIVQCIFQDSKGILWVGTDNGLAQYNYLNQSFKSFQHIQNDSTSLPNNNVYSISEDKDGYIWVGTDAGLAAFSKKKNEFITFTHKHGLPDNVIYGILVDDENNLWVSTNNGLSKLVRGNTLENFSFVNYNSSNWLHCNNFNIGAYYKTSDGILYFGCNEGITYFHPEDIKGNLYVPPVYLTKFQLFYKDVPITSDHSSPLSKHITTTDQIVLRHSQDILYFEFAALNYIQNEKNRFAFMMENFNDDWVYLSNNERSATFTNLDPGEYVFKVIAANNNGIWNKDGYELKIKIKPPFWKTWWFYISCVVGCVMIFYVYVHIRTHKLRQQRKLLEDKVQERTEEVLTQKEELQAALDNLKKTQTQLVDKEKMASLGQLTAGVAHEINNPINFVSGNVAPLDRDIKDILTILTKYEEVVNEHDIAEKFIEIEDLKEELDYDFLKDEINDLIKGIKEGAHRTSEIVKSLRSFSRLDENDLKRANINQGIESTLLILRNKIKNRIEVEKDFDDLPEIFCYPGKLNQVFMNILTNAAQAIIGEGKIFIKTRYNDGLISISIKDTGVGMAEDVRSKVFDPFFTTKDVGDGTGLGLSISFGIIETHNGTISVQSAPGEGTEFIIKIPERIDI